MNGHLDLSNHPKHKFLYQFCFPFWDLSSGAASSLYTGPICVHVGSVMIVIGFRFAELRSTTIQAAILVHTQHQLRCLSRVSGATIHSECDAINWNDNLILLSTLKLVAGLSSPIGSPQSSPAYVSVTTNMSEKNSCSHSVNCVTILPRIGCKLLFNPFVLKSSPFATQMPKATACSLHTGGFTPLRKRPGSVALNSWIFFFLFFLKEGCAHPN